MTIHFVYATPPGDTVRQKLYNRSVLFLQNKNFGISYVGKRYNINTNSWPTRAPYSITSHALSALSSIDDVLLYSWQEKLLIKGGKEDILIGHPAFPRDSKRVWDRSCIEGDFALRIAMLPLSHQMVEHCWEVEPFVPIIDAIFGIMGSYWYDTWHNSAIYHWKEKLYPFDMAIDANRFKRIKKSFNPPGKRKFFYIGWPGAQKGTHLLSILFGLAKQNQCIAIGRGPALPNIEQRPLANFSDQYLRSLADECDFFITMGVSDANPTTILEAMAWGFPVCCTPQSGYYNMPEINQMSITDMNHNIDVLNRLQYSSEDDLLKQADAARFIVEREYTWENFSNKLVNNIKELKKM